MTNQKRSLASLKSAFGGDDQKNTEQSSNNFAYTFYPFWNMEIGQRAVIRFVPDLNEANPRGFLVERVYHELTINGQTKKIPCLSTQGEKCPICDVSQAFYKAKDEINGKKYWKKRQYQGQALIIEDPLPVNESGESHKGKLRIITLGYQIFNIIKEAFASDELEGIPYDFEDGYDFIIKKTEQGKYGTYVMGTKFANRQRALTAEELAEVEENQIDLSTLLPKPFSFEKTDAMLNAEMNGEEYNDGSRSSSEDAPKSAVKTTSVTPTPVTPPPSTDEEPSTDVDEMLAKIQARRKKTAE
ncbi:MAG: hypothetical protein ACXW2E_00235 [Nitrososphaeraceae archaeon]